MWFAYSYKFFFILSPGASHTVDVVTICLEVILAALCLVQFQLQVE